jgi:hypothetical protein
MPHVLSEFEIWHCKLLILEKYAIITILDTRLFGVGGGDGISLSRGDHYQRDNEMSSLEAEKKLALTFNGGGAACLASSHL